MSSNLQFHDICDESEDDKGQTEKVQHKISVPIQNLKELCYMDYK